MNGAESQFGSLGSTGGQLEKVILCGETWVRKTESPEVVPQTFLSARETYLFDQSLFQGGAHIAKTIVGKAPGVTYTKYVSGKELLYNLQTDAPSVAEIQRRIVDSMQNGKYFSQSNNRHPGSFFEVWIEHVMHRIRGRAENKEVEKASPVDLPFWMSQAIAFLCSPSITTPMGFFPIDLNQTNIIVEDADAFSVIDQNMAFASPAIVAAKLMTGWRELALLPSDDVAGHTVFKEKTDRIIEADNAFLDFFLSVFARDIQDTLRNEVWAIQVIRNINGIRQPPKQQATNQNAFIESVMPFLMYSLDAFKKGTQCLSPL